MKNYSDDFALMPGHTWLNVASEGPLPKCANEALQEAIVWKSAVHLLSIPKFQQVPLELKKAIAALIRVDWQDVILGNSATYGLHLLANGVPFQKGDEVLLLQDDFPTDILPWLSLESKGVIVRQHKAQLYIFTPQELEAAINKKTRLVCLPLVHSFTGYKHDIKSVGRICRSKGVLLVVNLSQAAGAFPIDLGQWEADVVVCAGYKWLLGPYGTGFCWMKKDLRQKLNYPQNYWISLMDDKTLNSHGEIKLNDDHSARRYDVFGTANFFNFVPWQSSIRYLLSIGLDKIQAHNQALIDQFVNGLDLKRYELISPKTDRTNIAVFSLKDPAQNPALNERLKAKGFYLALWKNTLRLSPHLYNDPAEIKALLEAMA